MTGTCRPEAEQLVASAEGAEEAVFKPERGGGDFYRSRPFELSVGTVDSAAHNTATTLQKAVKIARCTRDNGAKDFPDPTPKRPLIDMNRNPSPARWGVYRIPGFQAAAGERTDLYLRAVGLGGK